MGTYENPFEFDFDSYIRQVEPSKQEKGKNWATAIGLQKVDGLTTSKYLYETAKRNIEGEISIEEAKKIIDSYYESKEVRTSDDENSEEADKVSARIAQILSEKTFSFNPSQLLLIHEKLFKGIFDTVKAGKFRTYNITKKEWALDGDTVFYANADLIQDTLKYDFENEKNFDYSALTKEQTVNHITRFVANIWQVHPFGEGNTRTTAVFTIMYLRSLGFEVNNEPFEKHSWYFRNALVRANYTNIKKDVYMNNTFLEKFFENLLLGKNNELKNRYTHIRYTENIEKTSVENDETFGSKEKTSVQILDLMKENPSITLQQIAEKIGLSKRAIEMQVKKLREQGKDNRIGATKKGLWEVRG